LTILTAEPERVIVDFPLRGEWVAGSTPAEKIPSHGSNRLGQRFAYDFVRIEREGEDWKFFRPSLTAYVLFGIRLEDCYGWGEPIHAPFDGTIVTAKDGWAERKRLHLLTDFALVLKNTLFFDPEKAKDLRSVLGNHVTLKMKDEEIYAFFAHARCGSVQVHEGDQVTVGQHLADVGHSGNSTAPHLHFHLMDRANIIEAQGVPCGFREYLALDGDVWKVVTEGIPGKREFIRYGEPSAVSW
jgi:hypothetical protein